jgi:hypothetical protein
MDTTTVFVVVYFVNGVVFGIAGALVGREKEAALPGFLFGFFLLLPGLIVVICAVDNREECPACKAGVPRRATICAKCRTPLEWMGGKPCRRSTRESKEKKSTRPSNEEDIDALAIDVLGPPPRKASPPKTTSL